MNYPRTLNFALLGLAFIPLSAHAEKPDTQGIWQGDFTYSAVTSSAAHFLKFMDEGSSQYASTAKAGKQRILRFADLSRTNPDELHISIDLNFTPRLAHAAPDYDRYWYWKADGFMPNSFGFINLAYNVKTSVLRVEDVMSTSTFSQKLTRKTSNWYQPGARDQECKITLTKDDVTVSGRSITLSKSACCGEIELGYTIDLEQIWKTSSITGTPTEF